MDEDDLKLLSCFQNLELDSLLEPTRDKLKASESNPFGNTTFRRRSKSLSSINLEASCSCTSKNTTVKHTTSFKRSNRKVLRDPVLKFLKYPIEKCDSHSKVREKSREKLFGQCSKHRDKDFKSLLDACEGLHLGGTHTKQRYSAPSFRTVRSPHRSLPLPASTSQSFSPSQQQSVNSSSTQAQPVSNCSTQARMSTAAPCDVTIDELASYFETGVHIPKKMSSMAEMMYI